MRYRVIAEFGDHEVGGTVEMSAGDAAFYLAARCIEKVSRKRSAKADTTTDSQENE